ncbi:MAG: chloride channel protein [Proteobacteria bacterium]|nr:chloride channel protein [Pseudomonadota bacterium]
MEEEVPREKPPGKGRWRLNRHVYLSVVAVLIGILGGYGAILFRFVIKAAQYGFYRNTRDILTFADTLPAYLKIGLPALGGLIVGLLVRFGAREARGPGVSDVMEAVAIRAGRMRPRLALVKILASGITIGSGGSAGREGPIVQIGSSIGSTVAHIMRAPVMQRRTFVGCGAAAGIAATFNAPIAGVLFAVEVILGDFGLATFSPLVLSSVTATTISRHYFGDFPAFVIPGYSLVSLWELCFYPLLGMAAGLAAVLFIAALYKTEDVFAALPVPECFKPALGGLLLGFLILQWPHVFGVGYGAINMSLKNQMPALLLLSLVFIKILATSITIGSGGAGGIFAPSLFIGAMTGGFFGWCLGVLFPGVAAGPGAYALVGMGALVAGTTHAPITAIITIFELTATYEIIVPLMISCIISTLVATSLKRGSIYTIRLARKGVELFHGWEQRVLRDLKIRDIMDKNLATIGEGTRLSEVIRRLKILDVSCLHVVDEKGALKGIISFRDIRPALQEEDLEELVVAMDLATPNPLRVTPSDSLLTALERMSEKGISRLPVVAEDDLAKVLGTVSQKDVMRAYNEAVLKRRERE